MPSPFPGMNPYLEHEYAWHDFHGSFMPEARNALTPQVTPKYVVKIDEHVYVHDLEEGTRRLVGRGDVVIPERTRSASDAGTAVLEAPARVRLPETDVESLSFLEVRDRQDRRLITVIELLSPSNKLPGKDRDQYLMKRAQLLSSGVNLVEIDLLRGGPRMPMTGLPSCDCCVLVSPVPERPDAGIWPIQLRDRLPTIPIPLRAGDTKAKLDLQGILNRIYDAAGYEVYIYENQPDPELATADAAWAREYLPKSAPA